MGHVVTRVLAPLDDCPKCGEGSAFLLAKPTHRTGVSRQGSEWLEWACIECGYTVTSPTADAEDPERLFKDEVVRSIYAAPG